MRSENHFNVIVPRTIQRKKTGKKNLISTDVLGADSSDIERLKMKFHSHKLTARYASKTFYFFSSSLWPKMNFITFIINKTFIVLVSPMLITCRK
jgi:hypothetical protein